MLRKKGRRKIGKGANEPKPSFPSARIICMGRKPGASSENEAKIKIKVRPICLFSSVGND